MSVKELLEKARAEFQDATPVVPPGVRAITHEKSAAERAEEARKDGKTPR